MYEALRDSVLVVQFKKCEKYPLGIDPFGKVAGWSLQRCQKCHSSMGVMHIFWIFANGTKSHKAPHIILGVLEHSYHL